MSEFMQPVRQELSRLRNSLHDDLDEFDNRLDFTRQNISQYIDRQIEYLLTIKNDFNDQFNYLEDENTKTCRDNQQELDKLCLTINQNDHDSSIVTRLLEKFKQTFPLRPTMLKSIPKYELKDINIDDFIIKQNSFDNNSSSPVINQPLNNGFHPIDEQPVPPLPTTSIGSSYHTQIASQNHDDEIEPQSRLTSTCSTISGGDNMLDLLFQIKYQHNRNPYLMCHNEKENCLLMYSLSSHQFEYLPLNARYPSLIPVPFPEPILNLGYSKTCHLFYCSTRKTNRFLLFRLNENEKEIRIDQEIELIKEQDHFISTHIHENLIYFLYLSSLIVMFGKYDLQTSSLLEPISFQNKLYDAEEKCSYDIIDFTVNSSYICFLIRLKNKNKYMIIIHDYETMNKIHSFDLIDAKKPLSIVSTERKLTSSITTMSNENIQSLLFINDVESHLIHCCSCQQYLIPIQVNAYGICSLNDGNLSLVASRDTRGLKIQDYLQRNNVQVE